jgi:hypothetical protein
LVFVPSPLLCYGLETLQKRLPASAHVLCVETDQALMALTNRSIPRTLPIHPQFTCIRADHPHAIADTVNRLGAHRFRRVLPVPLSGGYALNRTAYDRLIHAATETINAYWQGKLTAIHLGRLWVRNLLDNLQTIPVAADAASLRIRHPIVLCGAGESLEAALVPIARAREDVFLVAVDTAMPVLHDAGLRPDLVFALESQHANLDDLVPVGRRDAPIAADLTSYPGLLRSMTGPRYLFASEFPNSGILRRLNAAGLLPMTVPPLGSVGVAAAWILRQLRGSLPLIVTGLDFAYAIGKSHASGSPPHRRLLRTTCREQPVLQYALCINRPRVSVAGKDGNTVTSDTVLVRYARRLRDVLDGEVGVYAYGAAGADIGVPVLRKEDEFLRVLRHDRQSDAPPCPAPAERTAGSPLGTADAVRRFLRRELELLTRATTVAESGLLSAEPTDSVPIREALAAVDYVYVDFPDTPPLPRTEPSFLSRCVAACRHYETRIRRVLRHL